jgi:hypothetical protein
MILLDLEITHSRKKVYTPGAKAQAMKKPI